MKNELIEKYWFVCHSPPLWAPHRPAWSRGRRACLPFRASWRSPRRRRRGAGGGRPAACWSRRRRPTSAGRPSSTWRSAQRSSTPPCALPRRTRRSAARRARHPAARSRPVGTGPRRRAWRQWRNYKLTVEAPWRNIDLVGNMQCRPAEAACWGNTRWD